MEKKINTPDRNLTDVREQAAQQTCKSQQSKLAYDKKHKAPRQYNKGDLVMIRNFDSTPGVSRKMIPQFRDPYEITKTFGTIDILSQIFQSFRILKDHIVVCGMLATSDPGYP